MDQKDALKVKIKKNRKAIFELDGKIEDNRSRIEELRSSAERDNGSIARNYTAAFYGNHQLTNRNTEEIFKNRIAILNNMDVDGEVEVNFRETMINLANVDFFTHRAEVNQDVIDINEKLSKVNSLLIEINQAIMARNEKSVKFNKTNLETNKRFLNGEFHPSKATLGANSKRSKDNESRCEKLSKAADKNRAKIEKLKKLGQSNAANVLKNAIEISQRRSRITENQEEVLADQKQIAGTVFN
jgi:hypothetical protein